VKEGIKELKRALSGEVALHRKGMRGAPEGRGIK